jgi:hypothetical protein
MGNILSNFIYRQLYGLMSDHSDSIEAGVAEDPTILSEVAARPQRNPTGTSLKLAMQSKHDCQTLC